MYCVDVSSRVLCPLVHVPDEDECVGKFGVAFRFWFGSNSNPITHRTLVVFARQALTRY